jgi:hypothetical protein
MWDLNLHFGFIQSCQRLTVYVTEIRHVYLQRTRSIFYSHLFCVIFCQYNFIRNISIGCLIDLKVVCAKKRI